MKKLLVLLILTIGVYAQAQTEHNQGVRVGPDNVILTDVKEESGKLKAYKQGAVQVPYHSSADDSITIHRGALTALEAAVAALQPPGDTVPPTFLEGKVYDADKGAWIITFSEPIDQASYSSIISSTTLTQNEANVTINSIDLDVSSVIYNTADMIPGDNLKMSYVTPASNGIQDEAGNALATFTGNDVYIDNVIASEKKPVVWYKFNSDLSEVYGGTTGTASGTVAAGDSTLNFDNTLSTDYVDIGIPALTSGFTLSGRVLMGEDVNESYFIAGSGSDAAGDRGYYIKSTWKTSGNYQLQVKYNDGTTESFCQGTATDLQYNTWHDVAFVFDIDPGGSLMYCQIWVDDVQVNAAIDTTLNIGPGVHDGTWYLGNASNFAQGLRDGCKLDEFKLWNERLSNAYIDSLDTHPFRNPYEEVAAAPPVTIDDSVFFAIVGPVRFDDEGVVPSAYTPARAAADFDSFYSGTITSMTQLEIDDSDTCLVMHINSGANSADQFYCQPDNDTCKEFYYSADVQFKTGFQQAGGGKAFGMWEKPPGTNDPAGGVEGGLTAADGWSSRMGWSASTNPNQLDDYLYWHNGQTYGSHFLHGNKTVFDGRWINITRRYVLNDVGSANGIFEVFYDGVCVYSKTDLIFREVENITYNQLTFTIYFGGSDPAERDEYIKYDNMFLYQYQSDIPGSANYPDLKRGHNAHQLGTEIPLLEDRR